MSDITLADIRPGTVIVVCGKLAIVDEVKPSRRKNPIAYKNNVDHRGYICSLDQVQAVLGDVDLAKFQAGITPRAPRVEHNDTWAMPERLKEMGLEPGDTIEIRHGRGGTRQAIYRGYSCSRPKYPVSYELNGKQWKGVTAAIVRVVAKAADKAA